MSNNKVGWDHFVFRIEGGDLLEEINNTIPLAVITQTARPFQRHATVVGSAFAAADNPVWQPVVERMRHERPKSGLVGDEPNRGRYLTEFGPIAVVFLLVAAGDAEPYMLGRTIWPKVGVAAEIADPLGEQQPV